MDMLLQQRYGNKKVHTQEFTEFNSEVYVYKFHSHKNINFDAASYCCKENLNISVYEYICNKSLDWHLFGNTNKSHTFSLFSSLKSKKKIPLTSKVLMLPQLIKNQWNKILEVMKYF